MEPETENETHGLPDTKHYDILLEAMKVRAILEAASKVKELLADTGIKLREAGSLDYPNLNESVYAIEKLIAQAYNMIGDVFDPYLDKGQQLSKALVKRDEVEIKSFDELFQMLGEI